MSERASRTRGRCATASTRSSARCGAPSARSLAGVFSRWEEAVGPQIAAHARPAALVDGCLVVEVDHPTWATQLRFLETDLLTRSAGRRRRRRGRRASSCGYGAR